MMGLRVMTPRRRFRRSVLVSARDLISRPSPLDASRSPTLLSLSIVTTRSHTPHSGARRAALAGKTQKLKTRTFLTRNQHPVLLQVKCRCQCMAHFDVILHFHTHRRGELHPARDPSRQPALTGAEVCIPGHRVGVWLHCICTPFQHSLALPTWTGRNVWPDLI